MDHCPRNLVTLSAQDAADSVLAGAAGKHLSSEGSLAWITLLQNHENKTVEWLVAFG